jgi:DNA-binding NarL/FixJ family response regulator
MTTGKTFDCVLLADRHHGLTEGVRGLLETMFKTVVMVADEVSLQESAGRLQPETVVVDISLAGDGSLHWLQRLRQSCPQTKLIVLSFHDEPSVRRAAIEAGADGFVLTRAIATDLLQAIEAALTADCGAAPAGGSDLTGRRNPERKNRERKAIGLI